LSRFDPTRLIKALGYSMAGLKAAATAEVAFFQEIILAAITIPLACWLPVSTISKALMIASILLILIVELANSAIEAIVDRISLERHELSKKAKDYGSAMVFLTILNAIVVWGVILLG